MHSTQKKPIFKLHIRKPFILMLFVFSHLAYRTEPAAAGCRCIVCFEVASCRTCTILYKHTDCLTLHYFIFFSKKKRCMRLLTASYNRRSAGTKALSTASLIRRMASVLHRVGRISASSSGLKVLRPFSTTGQFSKRYLQLPCSGNRWCPSH